MESIERQAPATDAAWERGAYRLELGIGSRRGWRGELLVLAFFLLAACVLAWPIPVTLGQASGLRGDYYNNVWNAWWVKHSIVQGHSPYWTDFLYFPEGISLRRHTLSLLNSLVQASLTNFLDANQAFNVLLLLHFALSGWAFSLFARYVTGSTAGGILGGLVYSFCPFHYFYLCQINVFSFEFLPLGLLAFLVYVRSGGVRPLVGFGAALAGMAMSAEYFVVYAYLTMGMLLLGARAWAPEVAPALRVRRFLCSAGVGAAVAVAVAFPLLYATLGPESAVKTEEESPRINDLLGFNWLGPKEVTLVSWPTMLGYSTLLVLALGWKRLRGLWLWLLVGAVFFSLSLGSELIVDRKATGIPGPYALLSNLPVLSMLRKADRAYMMVQLVAALALAGAWTGLASRVRTAGARAAAWSLCALAMAVELTAVPFGRFEIPTSPYLHELSQNPEVTSILEVPMARTHVGNGRFDYFQTVHGKKTTLGYTTAFAVTPHHDQRLEELANEYWQFVFGVNRTLLRRAKDLGTDVVVHHKNFPFPRDLEPSIQLQTIWAPFVFMHEPLVRVRQLGDFDLRSLDQPFGQVVQQCVKELSAYVPDTLRDEPFLDVVRLQFTRAFGPPLHEDEDVLVFAVPKDP